MWWWAACYQDLGQSQGGVCRRVPKSLGFLVCDWNGVTAATACSFKMSVALCLEQQHNFPQLIQKLPLQCGAVCMEREQHTEAGGWAWLPLTEWRRHLSALGTLTVGLV